MIGVVGESNHEYKLAMDKYDTQLHLIDDGGDIYGYNLIHFDKYGVRLIAGVHIGIKDLELDYNNCLIIIGVDAV